MAPLNDAQVNLILERIIAGGITDAGLQNELLDHYCCFIEEKLNGGLDLELAYSIAFQTITPNGMEEIQEELYFILNFNQQTIMKRFIYGIGFLTVFCFSTLIMFKTMHWPGASTLFLVTFLLVIATAITLFSNSMKHWKSHTAIYNAQVVAGFIAALLISVGSIFKSLHYPTASIQIAVGILLLDVIFLPIFFYQLYQQAKVNTAKGVAN